MIYARYSSDLQNDRSIEDQIAACKQAMRDNETAKHIFVDRAKSGAFINTRTGIQALIKQIEQGDCALILTESLDRLSRSLEDIAHIYKLAQFHSIKIRTLLEDEITEMHICFNGAMASVQLQQIIERTRRGQIGNIMARKVAGGLAYGYRVRPLNAEGKIEPGLREIDPDQAAVIQSIYREYVAGTPVAQIVRRLNRDGIPSPTGKQWGATTIAGHYDRKDGILQNAIYRGQLVWGRCPEVKHPHTAQRQVRVADPEDWVIQDAPELRIVDDDLWKSAQARRKIEHMRVVIRRSWTKFPVECICARCSMPMIQNESKYLICSTYRRYHTCDHSKRIRITHLVTQLMGHIHENRDTLWHKWRNDMRRSHETAQAERARIENEIDRKQGEINNLVNALSGGLGTSTSITKRIMENEARIKQLNKHIATLQPAAPDLSPNVRRSFMRKLTRAKSEKQASQFVDKYIKAVAINRDEQGHVQLSEIRLRNVTSN